MYFKVIVNLLNSSSMFQKSRSAWFLLENVLPFDTVFLSLLNTCSRSALGAISTITSDKKSVLVRELSNQICESSLALKFTWKMTNCTSLSFWDSLENKNLIKYLPDPWDFNLGYKFSEKRHETVGNDKVSKCILSDCGHKWESILVSASIRVDKKAQLEKTTFSYLKGVTVYSRL